MANEKMTKVDVAAMLMEALEQFCDEYKDLRPALEHPFRQKDGDGQDCVMASDGHVLVCIKAKEAGVAVGKFKVMDDFNAYKVIPTIGFEDLVNARTVRREDLVTVIDQMEQHETAKQQVASADMCGVQLSMEGVSHIEVAMRISGADVARLVWHKDDKVLLQFDNDKRQVAVSILHMGWKPKDAHIISVPTTDDGNSVDARIDWQKGATAWSDIKAELDQISEDSH